MSKLYLAVIDFYVQGERSEAEWFHFVDSEKPSEILASYLAKKHLRDNLSLEPEDYTLENVWINEVQSVDGYNITVSK